MDYEQLQRYQKSLLDRALSEGIRRNEEQCKIWSEYRDRHEKVIQGLETFQRELTVDCMVPIGKRALMRGKLTRTNEILVSLGDGYLVKYSAAQAVELCNRRIKRANDTLEGLKKERDLFESRLIIPDTLDAFGGPERKDLLEHWDNEKLDDWRVKHREREKEYRKKLGDLKNTEKQEIQTEEDLFAKLDALELQEELEDELHRLEASRPDFYDQDLENGEVYEESDSDSRSDDSSTTDDDKNNDDAEKIPMVEKKCEREKITENSDLTSVRDPVESAVRGKKVVFGEPRVKYFDNGDRIEVISQCPTDVESPTTSRESSKNLENPNDDDLDDDDVVRIDVKHSDREPETPEFVEDSIRSPRDIYEMLSRPKSILKKSSNDAIPSTSHADPVDDSPDEEIVDDTVSGISLYNTVVREIREHAVDAADTIAPIERKRPVSKFKRERTAAKK